MNSSLVRPGKIHTRQARVLEDASGPKAEALIVRMDDRKIDDWLFKPFCMAELKKAQPPDG